MKAFWVIFHFGFLFLPFSFSSVGSDVANVNVHAAKELLGSGHRYLDVRTEEEFKYGHVENALNIPYMLNSPEGRVLNPKFVEQVSAVCSKEDRIIVGCQSGVRSALATTDLQNKANFKNVVNMEGGYVDWVKEGFAVKKPAEIRADL